MTMPPVRMTCHVIVTDSSSSTLGNGIRVKLSSLSKAHKRNPNDFFTKTHFSWLEESLLMMLVKHRHSTGPHSTGSTHLKRNRDRKLDSNSEQGGGSKLKQLGKVIIPENTRPGSRPLRLRLIAARRKQVMGLSVGI